MLNSLYVINTNMYVVVNFIHINMHLFLEKLNFDDGFFFTSTSSPFFFVQKVSIIYMSECTMLLCYYRIFDILACLYRISTTSALQVSLIPGHPALE